MEHDRTAARMAKQVNTLKVKSANELSDILGMLEYGKVVATSIPWLGKVMPKADGDGAIVRSKRVDLRDSSNDSR